MIFFISDTHFGHYNIIKYCNRPFTSTDEMDEELIRRWNKKVSPNDTVYFLGDLMFHTKKPASEYLEALNGKKHLIVGNHDRDWMKKTDVNKYFESVSPLLYMSDGKHQCVLCHYPMMTWAHSEHGAYMVYGHIHNNINGDFFPLILARNRMLNAGADVNNFEPVTFDEMVENNRIFKESLK